MKRRSLATCGVLAIVIACQSLTLASGEQDAWTQPRTAGRQPDLQGVWLNNDATPLERPAALAGRSQLTDAEVTEFRRRAAVLLADNANDFAAGDALFLAVLANFALNLLGYGITVQVLVNVSGLVIMFGAGLLLAWFKSGGRLPHAPPRREPA